MTLPKLKLGASKKEIFSYTVSSLANYTEEQKGALITKALFSGKTIDMLTPMIGVKTSQTVNRMDTNATFQAGGTCGWNASGATEFTQRTLTVGQIKIQEALCPKDLNAKYLQYALKAGSTQDALPFEDVYASLKAGIIAEQMETAVWQGDLTSGNALLNKFDGLLTVIGKNYSATGVKNINAITGTGTLAATSGDPTITLTGGSFTTMGIVAGDKIRVAGVTYTVASVTNATSLEATVNASATISGEAFTFIPASSTNFSSPFTSFTTASDTLITIMQSIFTAIPAALIDKEDLKVFMGWDTYRTLLNQITNGKYFNYTSDEAAKTGEMYFPGTTLKVVAVHGLNSTNRIIVFRTSNAFFGTDLMNEEEQFKIWYSQDNDEIRYHAEWKAGVQFGFLNEVLQFTLA